MRKLLCQASICAIKAFSHLSQGRPWSAVFGQELIEKVLASLFGSLPFSFNPTQDFGARIRTNLSEQMGLNSQSAGDFPHRGSWRLVSGQDFQPPWWVSPTFEPDRRPLFVHDS